MATKLHETYLGKLEQRLAKHRAVLADDVVKAELLMAYASQALDGVANLKGDLASAPDWLVKMVADLADAAEYLDLPADAEAQQASLERRFNPQVRQT